MRKAVGWAVGWAVVAALAVLAGLVWWGVSAGTRARPPLQLGQESPERGAYIFRAAGCSGCHSDPKRKDEPLAGGRALKTPFGVFYAPNITPDMEQGIGRWSVEDFVIAVREGVSPDGRHYYPVFPYTSYSGMSDRDILDLRAYLFTRPPIARASRPHEVKFPFNFRFLLGPWKALFFDSGPFPPAPQQDAQWNRGAYLVKHLGHCGECHSPRNFLGAVDGESKLAGNPKGPDGKKVPNITPHPKDGIGAWSDSDVTYFLKTGFFPDGDVAGGAMVDVIEESTSQLNDADRAAIAAYLRALPAIPGP